MAIKVGVILLIVEVGRGVLFVGMVLSGLVGLSWSTIGAKIPKISIVSHVVL